MPKKVTEANSFNQRLNANDYALVKFGRYKGFTYKEIGIAIGRTEGATGQLGYFINLFERGGIPRHDYRYETIQKALVLEAKIRAGQANDMRQLWINKLNRAAGEAITTVVRDELIEKGEIEVEKKQKEEVLPEETKTEEKSVVDDEPSIKLEMHEQPLVSFSVQINEAQILKILNIFFTK